MQWIFPALHQLYLLPFWDLAPKVSVCRSVEDFVIMTAPEPWDYKSLDDGTRQHHFRWHLETFGEDERLSHRDQKLVGIM